MQKDNAKYTVFTRRAFFLGLLQTSMLGVLGGRLAWLQIVEGQKYQTLAENNRINTKMLAPKRGMVFDRYGTPLATNDQNFRVLVTPEQTDNLEKALSSLQRLIDLSQNDIRKVLQLAQKSASFESLEVKDNLSWQDVAKIEVNLPDLPGLSIDTGALRTYPYGVATAHLVGYVGAVSKSDLTGDPVLKLPGFKIGKTALERAYDQRLRGRAGTAQVEVNVVGREVRELSRQPASMGDHLTLTIDADLQIFIQKRLEQVKSASAIVMDVHTGAVYGMCSSPAFDANVFTRGLSAEKWEEMLANPGYPLNNKAIGGQYPPGSTFKMVTALAALEEGVVNRNTRFFCPGHYDYGDDRFHCWKRAGHGSVDLVQALSESCDIYFYELATKLSIDRLAAYAQKLGYGQKYGFELIEERPGLMPTKAWKMGHMGSRWKPGETIVSAIGQGYIQSTPLQLAVMTARLVNGGFAVKPWLVSHVGAHAKQAKDMIWPKLNFQKGFIDLIQRGMSEAVNDRKGTAFDARIKNLEIAMGGKTGTAQVRRITMEQRREGILNENMPWKWRHHALFVGYAPLASPRYACAVVVEHGGSGSSTAAPIARDILMKTQERDPSQKNIVIADGLAETDNAVTPPHKPNI
jgi:penicillin-binding protein 2